MSNESRAELRSSLFLTARLRVAGGIIVNVTIRNLSSTGALIEAEQLPVAGTEIDLSRGELTGVGSVAWTTPGRCGIRFHAPIELAAWLPQGVVSPGQQRVDEVQAQVRAGERMSVSHSEAATVRAGLSARVAEELGFVSRLLETLGDELATDQMAARHGAQLQSLDIAIQLLGHLASVLAAPDPSAAIKQIGMEDLRRRLSRKSL